MLADRIRAVSDLPQSAADDLRRLCSSWQLLADLSFSDLMLYVPVAGQESFEVCAQVRPFTSQTLYLEDMVGTRVAQPEQPIVERAFRERRVWRQKQPVLMNGLAVRMDAIPVHVGGEVAGVVTREGSPTVSRRPGTLERVYLAAADHVSAMVCDGSFPLPGSPAEEWPRVGDGLFLLDARGRVEWASPNALSCLRRFGVSRNVVGCELEDLELGEAPVRSALASLRVVDGELARGDAHLTLTALPLLKRGDVVAGLCLVRDVSELRQREKVISVKEATIREIHHRVKNNLQTVASLLRLQSRRLTSAEAKAALEESVLRIGSIALVHETLSEQGTDAVDFGDVARRISEMVLEGLASPEHRIDLVVSGEAGPLAANLATPLAVALTELLQNTLEHAFPDGRHGKVIVDVAQTAGEVLMTVADDGVGIDAKQGSGSRLGLHIVRSLIDELGGSVSLESGGGTIAKVRVPLAG